MATTIFEEPGGGDAINADYYCGSIMLACFFCSYSYQIHNLEELV